MKLYYTPGACSFGIHVLLEQAGAACDMQAVALREGEQFQPGYTAVNPKSKIPALVRDDGSVLTEYGAIAAWIARMHPAAGLIPNDADAEARSWELLEYAVATIHMQGYARMMRPGNFTPNEADLDKVRARGREIFEKGLAVADAKLAGQPHAGERAFSVGDSALFYVCFWAHRSGIDMPPHVAAHYARMKAQPAAQRAAAAEGLTL